MKQPISGNFNQLLENNIYPSVSFYLPTHICGEDVREDAIRFKNLINDCSTRLHTEYPHEKVLEFLKPAFDLLKDTLFWQHQNQGLAVFIAPNFSHAIRLSMSPEPMVYVGSFFYVVPLIQTLTKKGTFYILSLSLNHVRLFEATRHITKEIDLPDTPKNIDEILQYEVAEEYIQVHTTPAGTISGGGALFHGQGDVPDEKQHKKNAERFIQAVAKGVDKHLSQEESPLILASVEYLQAIYRHCSSYRHFAEKGLYGNYDRLDINSLHRQAWGIIEPYFDKITEDILRLYHNLAKSNRTSADVSKILPAAYAGRVDTLLVSTNAHLPGKLDVQSLQVTTREHSQPGDEDLLNLASIYSFKNGTKVYSLEKERMPAGSALAAIFRY